MLAYRCFMLTGRICYLISWAFNVVSLYIQAQGSLSSDELRVHLSVPSDNVVINNTNTHTYSSRYQRIHTFPDDREGEYQEPSTVLRPREQCDSTGNTQTLLYLCIWQIAFEVYYSLSMCFLGIKPAAFTLLVQCWSSRAIGARLLGLLKKHQLKNVAYIILLVYWNPSHHKE